MGRVKGDELKPFEEIWEKYNQSFINKNINDLKQLYADDGDVIFFDNHKDCDSYNLEDHLNKVSNFFKTGNIVPLIFEDLTAFKHDESACMIVKLRYSNNPVPSVRTTFYLERINKVWKIRHIHCSFDPNE